MRHRPHDTSLAHEKGRRIDPSAVQMEVAMRAVRAISFAVLFTVIAGVACAADSMIDVVERVRKKHPHAAQLSTTELSKWLSDVSPRTVVLLDVRKEKEFDVSHLLNARRALTLDEALVQLAGAAKDTLIVAYCSVGYRSSELVEKLGERGFTNVYNLEGSIFQWANEGRAVYRGKDRVRCVHPYNRWWGRLLRDDLHDCPAEEPHSE